MLVAEENVFGLGGMLDNFFQSPNYNNIDDAFCSQDYTERAFRFILEVVVVGLVIFLSPSGVGIIFTES